MSKLLNCVLRWRHLTWPGDLTWDDLGPKFLHKMRKGWMNSYAKFGGAARRHFSAICEKPMGGGHICAPSAVRGLIWMSENFGSPPYRRSCQAVCHEDGCQIVCRISIKVAVQCGWYVVKKKHMGTPLPCLSNGWADCVPSFVCGRDPLDKSFTQVRGEVHLHVRTCTVHTSFPYPAND